MDARIQEHVAGCRENRESRAAAVVDTAEYAAASSPSRSVAGLGVALDPRRAVSARCAPRRCAALGGIAFAGRHTDGVSARFDHQEQRRGIGWTRSVNYAHGAKVIRIKADLVLRARRNKSYSTEVLSSRDEGAKTTLNQTVY